LTVVIVHVLLVSRRDIGLCMRLRVNGVQGLFGVGSNCFDTVRRRYLVISLFRRDGRQHRGDKMGENWG
jgi:hypothetical protein